MANIATWVKTPEGVEMIESQKMFCINADIWQGWKGSCIRVTESQLEDKEMLEVEDIDDTMQRVWFARKNRLQGRVERKEAEYDTRRGILRRERNEIIESISKQKELGIDASPDDLDQLKRLDTRMKRLVDEGNRQRLTLAIAKEDPETAAAVAAEKKLESIECEHCHELSPEGHKNPAGWRTGHMIHCKAKKEALVT